ncbi:MAG TPA: arginase family protein [Trebonia sp.]|jgi:agmatinase|nr:arginase family protein [Trebonia sp.]
MTADKARARGFDLWGAPFDGASTLGWPGSRYAPAKVREALSWMTMRGEDGWVYSLDTDSLVPFAPETLADRGDVAVVPHDVERTLAACSAAVTGSVRGERVPVVIGGDDSLLFGAARGLHDAVSGNVAVLHFDAHLDLMDSSPAQGRFSHSSGMRRATELERIDPKLCLQVGPRNFNFPSSRRHKRDTGLEHIGAADFAELGTAEVARRALERVRGADHVLLAFDIDVVDPAHAPGAGAHEPGGITSRQAMDAIRLLAPHCDALVLTEVNPLRDLNDQTANLAAYLIFSFVVFGSGTGPGHGEERR